MDVRTSTPGERASESQECVGADTLHELVLLALDSAFDSVLVHRADGRLLYANRSAAAELGMTPAQMMEAGPWAWSEIPPDGIADRLSQIRDAGTLTYLAERTLPDGTRRAAEIHSTWVECHEGSVIVSVARDATERLEAQDALHRLAFYDALTGLANRSMLDDRLKLAISSARRHGDLLGLLFIDIDDFKPVNDTYGHDAGDRVLSVISSRMANSVRTEDTVARVGGDEFVIVLPRLASEEDLAFAAAKVVDIIGQPIDIGDGCKCRVSASVGHAMFDPDHDDAHSLMIRADLAMYHARQTGAAVSSARPLE